MNRWEWGQSIKGHHEWVGNAMDFPPKGSTLHITEELNFRVRDGNGCFLLVLVVNP